MRTPLPLARIPVVNAPAMMPSVTLQSAAAVIPVVPDGREERVGFDTVAAPGTVMPPPAVPGPAGLVGTAVHVSKSTEPAPKFSNANELPRARRFASRAPESPAAETPRVTAVVGWTFVVDQFCAP